jgi:hypothetical protein
MNVGGDAEAIPLTSHTGVRLFELVLQIRLRKRLNVEVIERSWASWLPW